MCLSRSEGATTGPQANPCHVSDQHVAPDNCCTSDPYVCRVHRTGLSPVRHMGWISDRCAASCGTRGTPQTSGAWFGAAGDFTLVAHKGLAYIRRESMRSMSDELLSHTSDSKKHHGVPDYRVNHRPQPVTTFPIQVNSYERHRRTKFELL